MADTVFVVDNGLSIITNRLIGAGTEPKYLSSGTGTTIATATDIAMQTETSETLTTRITGVSSRFQTSTPNDTYQVVALVNYTGSKSITEIGLFDAISNGTMFLHGTFDAINVSPGDAIQFTVKVQFNQL